MVMYSIVGLVSSLAGCLGVWLSSPHQSVLQQPVSRRSGYTVGGVMLLAGAFSLCREMQPVAAIFLLMTWMMVWSVALPYLGGLLSVLRSPRS